MDGQHFCATDFLNSSSRSTVACTLPASGIRAHTNTIDLSLQSDPATIYAPVPHSAAKAVDLSPESMLQRTAVLAFPAVPCRDTKCRYWTYSCKSAPEHCHLDQKPYALGSGQQNSATRSALISNLDPCTMLQQSLRGTAVTVKVCVQLWLHAACTCL